MVRALLLVVLLAGCAEHAGTGVALTFTTTMGVAPEDQHYELFATVNGGAVSLTTFVVTLEYVGEGRVIKHVVDAEDRKTSLGVVDGLDVLGRPIGGVRFTADPNLTGASELFITTEPDGETDPAPTRDVIMACALGHAGSGTLSCDLVATGDKEVIRGTATLILPIDGVNGL